jgi:hypothetical protein
MNVMLRRFIWVFSMLPLAAPAILNAQSAARKALNADPRYQKLEAEVDRMRAAQQNPDPRFRAGPLDLLLALDDEEADADRLLQDLKKEAEACGHCEDKQAKYEEFATEQAVTRDALMSFPGAAKVAQFLKALRESNDPVRDILHSYKEPPTEAQLQEIELQYDRGIASGHCEILYGPQYRVELLAPDAKRTLQGDVGKYTAYTKEWTDRVKSCESKINAHVLFAQHRLALGRCLVAHDYEKTTDPRLYHPEQDAFNRCMSETDIMTAACTEDLYIRTWIKRRQTPTQGWATPQPCPPVLVTVTPPLGNTAVPQQSWVVDLKRVRAYASKPAEMAKLEQEAAGETPATYGLDTSIPPPVSPIPVFGKPVNSLGVPVGAKIEVTLLEPIDLVRPVAGHRYRAQLLGPANFRDHLSLSKGLEVSVRAYRKESSNPKFFTVVIEAVSTTIGSQSYPLPGSLDGPELQAFNALSFRALSGSPRPTQTMLPAGITLKGDVWSALPLRPDDPADAGSPLLREAPFPTDDPEFMHPANRTVMGAPRPQYSLLPGLLHPTTPFPIPVITAEEIDLTSDDPDVRFQAKAADPVEYQGDTVIPAGADVYLKVIRKGRNALYYQVALTVDAVVLDGKEIPLRTNQIARNARIPPEDGVPAPAPRNSRTRQPRPQRRVRGADTMPAGTRLKFSVSPLAQ